MKFRLTAIISTLFLVNLCVTSTAQVVLSPEDVEILLQQYQDQEITLDPETLDILLSQEALLEQPDDLIMIAIDKIKNPTHTMKLRCKQVINTKEVNPSEADSSNPASCYHMTDYTIIMSPGYSKFDKILSNVNDPQDTIRVIESCDGSRIKSMEYQNDSPILGAR